MGLEVIDQGRIGSGWRVAPDVASPGFELRSRSRLLFVLRAGEVSQYCLYIRVSGRRARASCAPSYMVRVGLTTSKFNIFVISINSAHGCLEFCWLSCVRSDSLWHIKCHYINYNLCPMTYAWHYAWHLLDFMHDITCAWRCWRQMHDIVHWFERAGWVTRLDNRAIVSCGTLQWIYIFIQFAPVTWCTDVCDCVCYNNGILLEWRILVPRALV